MRKTNFSILAIVIFLLTGCSGSPSPTQTVNNFFETVKQGKYTEATLYISTTTSNTLKQNGITPEKYIEKEVAPGIKDKFSIKTTSEKINGNKAIVTADVFQENKKMGSMNFILYKEGNTWKLAPEEFTANQQ